MDITKIKKLMKVLKLNKLLYDKPKYKLIEKEKSSEYEYIATNLVADIDNEVLILTGDEDDMVIGRILEYIDDIVIGKTECNIKMKNGDQISIKLVK